MEPEASASCSKEPKLVPISSQVKSVHASNLLFSTIHLETTLIWIPRFSNVTFSLQILRPKLVSVFLLFRPWYMLYLSHPPWFDHPNNIWRQVGLQILRLYITLTLSTSCYVILGLNILINSLFSNTQCYSLNTTDSVSHPYKTAGKTDVSYIANLYVFR